MNDDRFSIMQRVVFGDLDAMRHVNNVRFLRWFETARIAYMRERSGRRADQEGGQGFILAECHINYRAPAFYDEEIRTWVAPSRLRRSSFRMRFRMEAVRDDRVLAEGWGTLVGYDYRAGTASALPDGLVERLRAAGAERDEDQDVVDARA
jgi:acyl-CoA thioester hydrolase